MAQRLGGAARALVASILTLSTAAYVAWERHFIERRAGGERGRVEPGRKRIRRRRRAVRDVLADCNGGYCNAGVCCANAAAACSTGCCAEERSACSTAA
ncbi:MAG: hypothetical protein U0235_26310 [Polyangiaceae bacterium]